MRATAFWVQALKVGENESPQRWRSTNWRSICRTRPGLARSRRPAETCRDLPWVSVGIAGPDLRCRRRLDAFTERVNAWQVMGDVYAGPGINELANLLTRIGYHDGAARLWAAISRGASQGELVVYAPSIPTVRNAMGPVAFALAYEADAALDPRSSGQLAHQLIAQVRDDHAQT